MILESFSVSWRGGERQRGSQVPMLKIPGRLPVLLYALVRGLWMKGETLRMGVLGQRGIPEQAFGQSQAASTQFSSV